jgi:sporulation protein YlmC with PRC-barrel domain
LVEARLDLVRDLLDAKVMDRHGREMGRVDGVVIAAGGAAAPRVTAIEIGPSVLFRRIHPAAGRWMAGLERALGLDTGRPLRIPFEAIIDIGDHVRVDLAVGETAASALEHRLRDVFKWIPGGS